MNTLKTKPKSSSAKSERSGSPDIKHAIILGSTGSIGVNALRVVTSLGERCRVVGLSAYGNIDRLIEQIHAFHPEVVCVGTAEDAARIRSLNIQSHGKTLQVLSGLEGLVELATWPGSNFVLSSVVGAIGLRPLMAALKSGRTVALANKEALIMAGSLVMAEAKRSKALLLPVDSEHSAIFQCLEGNRSGVRRLILTASGGPFYRSTKPLDDVTVEEALNHPTWKMGKKITIDSATLMNKGIETIEAAILYDLPIDKVDIVIHPQSIVHSMVDFVDGAMIAQLSWPDMCLPIQYAMTYPERIPGPLAPLDLVKAKTLEFYEPDFKRFPCLSIAREAARRGGLWPAVMNAANEEAVHAFLSRKIRFMSIPAVIEKAMERFSPPAHMTLDAVLETDAWARTVAKEHLK